MARAARIVGGTIASPSAVALVWALPSVGSSAFLPLLLFNGAVAFVLFAVCAGLAHVILRWKRWTGLRQYFGVMFGVATMLLLFVRVFLLQWVFGDGGSEYHLGTHVIENGRLTLGGAGLTLIESMFGAAWLAGAFALFWVIAVRPRSRDADDA